MLGTAKMTPQRKLQRVKINLLRNPKVALMSGVLMVGKTYVDDSIPTARTNGRDEWYSPQFITDLKEKELAFVVLHESCHKMYRHLTTWKKLHDENHALANMACDYVINIMLKDLDPYEQFIAMPTDKDGNVIGLVDERFRGMNAKQVFDILKEEQQPDGGSGEGGTGGTSAEGNNVSQPGKGFDDHDWDGANSLTEEEKKELAREVDQAIRQGIIAKSKQKGGEISDLDRAIGELVKAKVDWRDQLREYVKSVCAGRDVSTWRKPNRRFIGADVFMPTLVSERVHHIVAAIDTSGSIGGSELNAFMSEFVAICEQVNPESVDLMYWGSHVAGHEKYGESELTNIVSSTRPVGGGGTAPSCITTYMNAENIKPDCVVVLTDGYVGDDWGGDWPCPVLWCVMGNEDAMASTGKTIHIND